MCNLLLRRIKVFVYVFNPLKMACYDCSSDAKVGVWRVFGPNVLVRVSRLAALRQRDLRRRVVNGQSRGHRMYPFWPPSLFTRGGELSVNHIHYLTF